jgi:hypothetical protein
LYPHKEDNGKTLPIEEEEFLTDYPQAYNYNLPFKEELIEKKIRYKTNPKAWYSLHRSREISLFEQDKIVTPETSLGGNMTIDRDNFYHNTQVYTMVKKSSVELDLKIFLAILNSEVFWFFLKNTGAILRGGYFRFKTKYLEPFPIPALEGINNQEVFIEKVDTVLTDSIVFSEQINKFLDYIKSQYHFEKSTKKMKEWYALDYGDFLKELKKIIKKSKGDKLSKSEEMEWMELFEAKKSKAMTSKMGIEQTNSELNSLVYSLYGFSKNEIEIIEEANA